MRQLSSGSNSLLIPNTFFCTASRYAYVKYTSGNAVKNQRVTLKVGDVKHENASIYITRTTDAHGEAVFPVGGIAEALVKDYGADTNVMFEVFYDGGSIGSASRPIVGYADYEIKSLNGEAKNDPDANNYPAAKKIVIYPRAGFDQQVFVPVGLDVALTVARSEDLLVTAKGPLLTFSPFDIEHMGVLDTPGLEATITLSTGKKSILLPAEYDLCTDGVFLRWIDKSGMPYVYRWTPEAVTDEMSVEFSTTRLDENLHPYQVQAKTLAKRYTLHSRIVERDIFEMCKTVLANQRLWMYDTEAADWVECTLEEGEAADSGDPMKDLIIEVVKHTYNL